MGLPRRILNGKREAGTILIRLDNAATPVPVGSTRTQTSNKALPSQNLATQSSFPSTSSEDTLYSPKVLVRSVKVHSTQGNKAWQISAYNKIIQTPTTDTNIHIEAIMCILQHNTNEITDQRLATAPHHVIHKMFGSKSSSEATPKSSKENVTLSTAKKLQKAIHHCHERHVRSLTGTPRQQVLRETEPFCTTTTHQRQVIRLLLR